MFELAVSSSKAWLDCVMNHFDEFLLDHASCEKKASGMATSLLSHYPDRTELVERMIELALEELNHFRQVVAIIHERGLQLSGDAKDPYIQSLRALVRTGADYYLLDRLLIAGIVERRGHERFGLIAEALPEGSLKSFYDVITRSEGKHHELFVSLALKYFKAEDVHSRLDELVLAEGKILEGLVIRPALH